MLGVGSCSEMSMWKMSNSLHFHGELSKQSHPLIVKIKGSMRSLKRKEKYEVII
jgi:hypothetical protein